MAISVVLSFVVGWAMQDIKVTLWLMIAGYVAIMLVERIDVDLRVALEHVLQAESQMAEEQFASKAPIQSNWPSKETFGLILGPRKIIKDGSCRVFS